MEIPVFIVVPRSENPTLDLTVVMRAFEGGGAQRDMILLCNALAAKGLRIHIVALKPQGSLRDLIDPAIAISAVPGRQMRYAIPGLRRLIGALAPRSVISSEAALNLCTLIAVRSLPRRDRPKLILREVGSPSIAERNDPYRQNRIAYRILRRVYRFADRIVTLTEGARDDLTKNFGVSAKSIAVMLTNAVVTQDVTEQLEQWDGESGRENDLIVCIGRLSPEKDQATLIRAVALLPAALPWRLAMVGDGAERANLETLARKLGIADRVIFAGHVADPFPWMRRARVAVCSSVYEGLCNAIIEALACGTPVVSTDCPYGPVEILQRGRYGTLIPIGDAAAMAAALEAALLEVQDRAALMARGRNYTAARAADRFLEILAELQPAPAARPFGAAVQEAI
ncbi:MAG TPA: glycosyltransferase [Xanthobacteraceae bacterium]|nr:glycosyltransferase [Xanthobacteraceae bacterium]